MQSLHAVFTQLANDVARADVLLDVLEEFVGGALSFQLLGVDHFGFAVFLGLSLLPLAPCVYTHGFAVAIRRHGDVHLLVRVGFLKIFFGFRLDLHFHLFSGNLFLQFFRPVLNVQKVLEWFAIFAWSANLFFGFGVLREIRFQRQVGFE